MRLAEMTLVVTSFTFGLCFLMFVYIRVLFHFTLIGGNLTAQLMGSHKGIGGGIQIPETLLQAPLPFPTPPPKVPWRARSYGQMHDDTDAK